MNTTIFTDKVFTYPLDPDFLIRKKKAIRRELLNQNRQWIDKRIAILGGSTTNDIQDFLEIFLLKDGIRPIFYTSEYNRYWEDAVFGNPELDAFKPDVIFVHTTSRNITEWPTPTMEKEQIDNMLFAQFEKLRTMWTRLFERYQCPIIQNNFDRPPYRLMGNRDIYDEHGHSNFVYRINGMLYEYAVKNKNFFIHDIDYLSAQYGQGRWQSFQYWSQYKYALNLKAIPEFSYSLANIIKSIYGKNKKVIAVDLDNTLWGGVVGDDGPENLMIGRELAAGENFLMFQNYLKQMKQFGVLLAVNSKNDKTNAIAGLNHPDGALRPEDFAVIEANWTSKDVNIQNIAKMLNLGLDSFVFVDDNPAEREIVKRQIPAVAVIDAEDPICFCEQLDRGGYFEITSLTKDDLARNDMYRANLDRIKVEQSFASYQEYLESLEMKATVKEFDRVSIQRIAQLTNKTNQFNLTTKRYSEAQMLQMAENPEYISLYGRLEDKFGDNGIVTVVLGKKDGDKLHIDLWLMSCRVLKRDLEYAVFDRIVEICKQHHIKEILGDYFPTAKNGMVKEFYADLGFDKIAEDDSGHTKWRYFVSKHKTKNKAIKEIIK